jgi:hypothetical protein
MCKINTCVSLFHCIMSDTDRTWAQLRKDLWDLWWRPPGLTREAVWDAVFTAAEKGVPYQTAVFGIEEFTLLHLAVRDNLPAVVQRLMAMGMSPARLNKHGWNAMHVATYYCKTADVCMVLPHELLTGTTLMGNTPLQFAVELENVQLVQWMLDQPCCPVETRNKGGRTALETLPMCSGGREAVAIRAAFAARQRWTALRAAWVGAIVFSQSRY